MEEDHVRFICKRTVVSTKPVEPGQLYNFSVLDHVMEPNHIRLVYYYQSSDTTREPGDLTKKLRESLAYTLNCYPIITGRLVKENDGTEEKKDLNRKWRVKSNDAGMRMVESRATGSVQEWLKNVNREEELKLVHWEEMYNNPYYWSTFYVQVTEFEKGGLAIGLSCSHLLADPICAMMFMRAWSDFTLSRNMMAPPLFHSLPPRRFTDHTLSNNQLLSHYIKSCTLTTTSSNVTKDRMVTLTLLFPDPMVRAADKEPGVSSFEILAGLFWVCVSRAKGKKNEFMDMSLCLDARKLLRLEQGYFGNCMVYHKVNYTKPFETKDRSILLSNVVQKIHDVTKRLDYDMVMDLIEWLGNNNNPISTCSDLVCTNLENMTNSRPMMFEKDLILSHVSCYVEGHVAGGGGQVIVLPAPASEGPMSRVVMVSLPQKEMVKVIEDELLLSFSPIVLKNHTQLP